MRQVKDTFPLLRLMFKLFPKKVSDISDPVAMHILYTQVLCQPMLRASFLLNKRHVLHYWI